MRLKTIITDYKKGLLLQETETYVGNEVGAMNVVNLYPEITYQTVQGFGGAFTEATGYNVSKLSKENSRKIAEAYYGKSGIGYTLGRTHINSCDFGLGNYAYVNDSNDTELNSFDRNRDREYVVPFLKQAQEGCKKKITFLASPWSPPAFMKTNGEMNNGGKLKDEYRTLWANYIAKYIIDCKKDGIDITMLTVQNEPQATQTWDSCRYTAEEEMEFVRDYLGPILEEENLGHVKIFIWDHNKEIMFERAREILKDEKASSYIAGVAFHWYTGDHFESVQLVREQFPDKELFFTEGCVEYSRFMDSNEVYKAEMYAHDILGNFVAGMNGYIDWNLVLDEKGGPNHVGNFCAAPIMCNLQEDTFEKRLSYYYIGQFSKFVLPGAKRIATTKYTDRLELVGFINPDGQRIVVVLNKKEEDITITLREHGIGTELIIGAHSIVTICCE